MSIRNRLWMVFGILFLFLMILLAYSIHTIGQMNRSVARIVQDESEGIRLAQNVRNEINILAKELRNYALSDSAPARERHLEALEQARSRGTETLLALEQRANSDQELLVIKRIKEAGGRYLEFQQAVIDSIAGGRTAETAGMLVDDGQNYQQALFSPIEELVMLHEAAMRRAADQTAASYRDALRYYFALAAVIIVAGGLLTLWTTRRVTDGLTRVAGVMKDYADRDFQTDARLDSHRRDEIGDVAKAFNRMADTLRQKTAREQEWLRHTEERSWLNEQLNELNKALQPVTEPKAAAELALSTIMPQLGAPYGVLYLVRDEHPEAAPCLEIAAGYALADADPGSSSPRYIAYGEGLAGQCALEKKALQFAPVPGGHIRVRSGLGESAPQYLRLVPLLSGDVHEGVLELAGWQPPTPAQEELLAEAARFLALYFHELKNRQRIRQLLDETQSAAEELQLQQEELEALNAELEEQTTALRESEQQLQLQQAELEDMNLQLREKTVRLERQNEDYSAQNLALAEAKRELERKAAELSDAIGYKSAFLANMSHELRTPLNSMLILAKHLADNKDGNLTDKQVEFAATVHSSGRDLLALINDILDLAKIEAKKNELHEERIGLSEISEYVKRHFQPLAQQKALDFRVRIDPRAPAALTADRQKLLQILQNLLSNAFKFTERGSVAFSVDFLPDADAGGAVGRLAFTVGDTGIGIEPAKQDIIFDAFVQADGTTSRKYGGTGLGLSICKQLAALIGGQLRLSSRVGEGSEFTLLLPVADDALAERETAAAAAPPAALFRPPAAESAGLPQPSRRTASPGLAGKTLLIADDDGRNVFALSSVLEAQGVHIVYAENGREAIDILEREPHIDAVLMDIMMPEMDGYEAMRQIRRIPRFKKLPILAVTAKAMKDDRDKCIRAGATDYITKPVDTDQLLSLLKVWLYP